VRNNYVAKELNKAGLATLLMDLLTEEEEKIDNITFELRFDIELLAQRLSGTTEWLKQQLKTKNLKIGYFGASTGAAAALIAASQHQDKINAVVSRGGRADMAIPYLEQVKAPTLLIVGGDDTEVIEMNKQAMEHLTNAQTKLEIIPGAGHLFEEPGTLEQVADLTRDWMVKYLK
jgi:dienelactone hydrolase